MKLKMWLIPAALVGMMLWPFSVKAEEDTIHFSLNIDELTDENGYLQADADCRTALPRVYAAGDTRSKTLRQLVTATADGALAASSAVADLSGDATL